MWNSEVGYKGNKSVVLHTVLLLLCTVVARQKRLTCILTIVSHTLDTPYNMQSVLKNTNIYAMQRRSFFPDHVL